MSQCRRVHWATEHTVDCVSNARGTCSGILHCHQSSCSRSGRVQQEVALVALALRSEGVTPRVSKRYLCKCPVQVTPGLQSTHNMGEGSVLNTSFAQFFRLYAGLSPAEPNRGYPQPNRQVVRYKSAIRQERSGVRKRARACSLTSWAIPVRQASERSKKRLGGRRYGASNPPLRHFRMPHVSCVLVHTWRVNSAPAWPPDDRPQLSTNCWFSYARLPRTHQSFPIKSD